MLEFIREKAKGIVAWAILILIGVPFALWGINNYFTGSSAIVVAEVNGEEVTADEFARAYEQARRDLQEKLGESFATEVDEAKLKREVLDQLINAKLIESWIEAHHMAIGDHQLALRIRSLPFFLDEQGKFSQKKYEEILQRNGLSVAQFERLQRLSMLQEQFMDLTRPSSFATKRELNQLLALQRQERKIGWLQLDLKPYLAQVNVSDKEARAYYEAHKDAFVEPEKYVVEYVLLDRHRLAQRINPDEKTLRAFYEENKNLFVEPEQRRARHILIELPENADEKAQKAAQAKLAEVQKALKDGEDFAEVAKRYSDDPGSAAVGGDLGYFEAGTMVPAFDKKVFSMKKGEVSEPIRTPFGYHIIRLEDIKPRKTPSFEAVRDQVLAQYRQQQADKQYFDLMEKMNTAAYEQPDSLAPAAEAIGGKVETSPPFSRQKPWGFVASPKVRQALFSDEVFKQRLNSEAIELGPDQAVALRLKAIEPSRQLTFDEVRDRVVTQLKREKALKLAQADMEKILAEAKKGQAIDKAISPEMTWHAPIWAGRQDRTLPADVLNKAFELPKPQDGKPTWHEWIKPSGEPVLIVVEAVRASQQSQNEADRLIAMQLKSIVTDMMADVEMASRLAELRARADIEINESYLAGDRQQ